MLSGTSEKVKQDLTKKENHLNRPRRAISWAPESSHLGTKTELGRGPVSRNGLTFPDKSSCGSLSAMLTAHVNGTDIAYADGGGDSPVVVLSHGYLMDRSMFDPQVARSRPRVSGHHLGCPGLRRHPSRRPVHLLGLCQGPARLA